MTIGKKFGHLVVIRVADSSAVCSCICQRTVRAPVDALERGAITSCGCRELTAPMRAAYDAARADRKRERTHRQMWSGRR
jgi:hypothetical protein